MNKIESALTKLFDKHRIVFWYDTKKELRKDFESIGVDGVEKVELNNNEFSLKYRMLRQEPDTKFLLYHEGKPPKNIDNWLLDVQLASGEFHADQVAIWLAEMELGIEFMKLFEEHQEFFKAAKRRNSFKSVLKSSDTHGDMRLKMLATCSGSSEPKIDAILENLLAELANDGEEKSKLISRCKLDTYLWDLLHRHYGYESEVKSIKDFSIELFKSCFAMALGDDAVLNQDALVFMRRWQDSRSHHDAFETLSEECADILGIEASLDKMDIQDLLEVDYFKLVEMKILSELIHGLAQKSLPVHECDKIVRTRRSKYWYEQFQDMYESVAYAAEFMQQMDAVVCNIESIESGLTAYQSRLYRIDQLYRKFIYHARRDDKSHLVDELAIQIENHYTNNFLLKLNDNWQSLVDGLPSWMDMPAPRQNQFFKQWVAPYLERGNKVCVVISDAMRYEVGEELLGRIRQEDRYDAKMESMISMLPSYTQLGMASLLPHDELAFAGDESSTVVVDGQSSQGTANREKILRKAVSSAKAIQAEAWLALKQDDSRAITRDHEVVYIYHNRIDKTGDTRDTEGRVFEAAEDTLDEIIKVIKKLYNANASNIIVTADHGFIYQNRKLDESDFSAAEADGDEILFRDRRFILGKGLKENPSLKKFDAQKLGLTGDVEVLISKSINRLRLKGSGSRFVHGGATLQEIVVPVIQVSKKRKSDVGQVEVDFIGGSSSVITSGQFSAAFYQQQPCSEKVQSRTLSVGIYNEANELISDKHELVFDSASDDAREREVTERFVLTSQAEKSNNQDVYLKLKEQVKGTAKPRLYKQARYTIRRSFTSDFDDL